MIKTYRQAYLSLAGYNGTKKAAAIYSAEHLIGAWWKTQVAKDVWYKLSSSDWWLLYADADRFVKQRIAEREVSREN